MNVRGRKIFVGLSGGVDSAVSAALLKKQEALVTGVFIKGWYPSGMPCTWATERRDAMRVAARLRIPFHTLEAGEEYKKSVIDYLLSEYSTGRTPNPDIMCNKEIKFGRFYRYAMENGADSIATGHYRCGEKDQSYFLWAVPKDILNATIFPVGMLDKDDVRKLAKKFNLPVAEKRDSQGICFLGPVSVKEFLEKELGTDNPAILYTLGQRVDGEYVVGKDIEKKEIKTSKTRASGEREVRFRDANWHQNMHGDVISIQLRYRGERCAGRIEGNRFISINPLPDAPAPGQSLVFYNGGEMIGGGIISA
jgi:tRNA-uridine 2-sulfurtransferase